MLDEGCQTFRGNPGLPVWYPIACSTDNIALRVLASILVGEAHHLILRIKVLADYVQIRTREEQALGLSSGQTMYS
jgi:hypothetical protein